MGDLQLARALARRFRFSGDKVLGEGVLSPPKPHLLRELLYQNSIKISPTVTPALAASVESACTRLQLPKECVEAFIVSSPDVQAECLTFGDDQCVLRFTSALVNLLSSDEFEFVVGHEVGHFLLGHRITPHHVEQASVEFFMQQRRQEISVDRIGLLASSALDSSIRALMKTVSGLSGEHIRFDVGEFVQQLKSISDVSVAANSTATHPSILVRCRALLWFSLSNASAGNDGESTARVDENIERDLDRYVDGPAKRTIGAAVEELALWMSAYEIVQAGVFTKERQQLVARLFDVQTMERLKVFLSDVPKSEADGILFRRVDEARQTLEGLIPMTFEREVHGIRHRISEAFAKS